MFRDQQLGKIEVVILIVLHYSQNDLLRKPFISLYIFPRIPNVMSGLYCIQGDEIDVVSRCRQGCYGGEIERRLFTLSSLTENHLVLAAGIHWVWDLRSRSDQM